MKAAVVDMGGGMRGAFSAGIYDALMDRKSYPFDFAVGVSAGASNLSTYIAGQRGRLIRYYTVYPWRKEYMGIGNIMRKGVYIDLEYVYETLSFPDGEDPFDIDAYHANPMGLTIVATDAETGMPAYFGKDELQRCDMRAIEASAAVPVACHPILYKGRRYFDGGIADTLPYEKAFELGADRVVVILTKPHDFLRTPKKDRLPARIVSRKYPATGRAIAERYATYNRQLKALWKLEEEGKVLIIAPDSTEGIDTMKHSNDGIMRLYEHGYEKASMIDSFLRNG